MVIKIASLRNFKTIVITVLNAKVICLGRIALFFAILATETVIAMRTSRLFALIYSQECHLEV
ncbi:hypothetical protein IO98_14820 [Lacrimispora celerecrescens]|uniref:Uncharacterized protein n=1 Tax=Lacrimispora celerecrescens TaxID=29354 RepID=A0A084JJX6_9FIRM|nr:hypothetical protein IO98_14820 [Lacrimispora celerecrescens]